MVLFSFLLVPPHPWSIQHSIVPMKCTSILNGALITRLADDRTSPVNYRRCAGGLEEYEYGFFHPCTLTPATQTWGMNAVVATTRSKHRIRGSIRGRCTTMRCFRVGRPPWLRKKGKDRNQLVQCSDLLCIGLKGAIHQPAASHLVPKARGVAAQASPADNLDIS